MPTTVKSSAVDVDAQGLEVEPDRLPGAARGDAHLLVVVALRAAGGERVARARTRGSVAISLAVSENVAVPLSAATTRYGSSPSCRTTRAGGTTWPRLEVVGHVQHGADEHPVAGQHLALVGLAVGRVGQLLADEAALGAGRHDDRVLHLLRLGQAEDLGAEVLRPVRPAQPAAGDVGEPQVHALEPGRVDEQLELRAAARAGRAPAPRRA